LAGDCRTAEKQEVFSAAVEKLATFPATTEKRAAAVQEVSAAAAHKTMFCPAAAEERVVLAAMNSDS
jgi:hypothetical protein